MLSHGNKDAAVLIRSSIPPGVWEPHWFVVTHRDGKKKSVSKFPAESRSLHFRLQSNVAYLVSKRNDFSVQIMR